MTSHDLTYLSKVWIGCPDDCEVSWNNLLYVGYTFNAETFEDERNGLYDHSMMLGQGWVADDSH